MTHPLTAPLIEKHRQVGPFTPEGRRYSTLIGQLENVETVTEPWRRSNLLAGIQRSISEISQIQHNGGRYIHKARLPFLGQAQNAKHPAFSQKAAAM